MSLEMEAKVSPRCIQGSSLPEHPAARLHGRQKDRSKPPLGRRGPPAASKAETKEQCLQEVWRPSVIRFTAASQPVGHRFISLVPRVVPSCQLRFSTYNASLPVYPQVRRWERREVRTTLGRMSIAMTLQRAEN